MKTPVKVQTPEKSEITQQLCENHPQKKGKYQIKIQNIYRSFCSKCAIDMVQDGHQSIENNKVDKPVNKMSIIKDFLFKLKQVKNKLQTEIQKIIQIKNKNNDCQKNSIQRNEKYLQMKIDPKIQKLKSFIDDISSIQKDIEINTDSIVKEIDTESFQQVIQNYTSQIQQIENSVEFINLNSSMSENLLSENKQASIQKPKSHDFNLDEGQFHRLSEKIKSQKRYSQEILDQNLQEQEFQPIEKFQKIIFEIKQRQEQIALKYNFNHNIDESI